MGKVGFCDAYRRTRRALSVPESMATLDQMQDYFQDGANWTQGMYENADGARCLVGAANHVRVSSIDDAKNWIRLAIAEVMPGAARIEDFNDGSRTFAEVAAVIERARQLAAQSVARALPPPAPALHAPAKAGAEVVPLRRQALPAAREPVPAKAGMFVSRKPARVRRRPSLAEWIMD
jgi:hypothetical protein